MDQLPICELYTDPNFPRKEIAIHGDFDPSFFPDGSGFMFQGSFNGLCRQQILENPDTKTLNFTEPGCSRATQIPLYQSVGASLEGSSYFAAAGVFTSDSGRPDTVEPPSWLKRSYIKLIHVLFDGEILAPMLRVRSGRLTKAITDVSFY